MIKFANKRVNGWKNRHINMTKVANALYARRRNGFTLDSDEQKFLDDYHSLRVLYMPNGSIMTNLPI